MKERIMIFLAAILMTLSTSCKRDHLYYASSDTATVLVKTDWSRSGVHPNGVTVFAYRESDGSLYKRFPPVSAEEKNFIKLPEGDFVLVVMNDTPEEFGGSFSFMGVDCLGSLQAVGLEDWRPEGTGVRTVDAFDPEFCMAEPDTLSVAVVGGVHVSPEQIDYFYDRPQTDISMTNAIQVSALPEPVISRVNISAHVKGLKYARGTTVSYLSGLSSGYYLGLESVSEKSVSQAFILNNRAFDPGSDSDGTIRTSILSFGPAALNPSDVKGLMDNTVAFDGKTRSTGGGIVAEGCRLNVNFVLINGESYPVSVDVSDAITVDNSLGNMKQYNIRVEIHLPEAVGKEEGGFTTDINEWEDEIVNIPI